MRPIPMHVDQARLRPHLRAREERADSEAVELIAAGSVAPRAGVVVVPSPGSLRGLPVVGSGQGAIAGTNPSAALIAKEQRRR
jgi:hypothetical protein